MVGGKRKKELLTKMLITGFKAEDNPWVINREKF